MLLSRERVNKETKRMISLPFPPLVISLYHTRFFWENRRLKIGPQCVHVSSAEKLSNVFMVV